LSPAPFSLPSPIQPTRRAILAASRRRRAYLRWAIRDRLGSGSWYICGFGLQWSVDPRVRRAARRLRGDDELGLPPLLRALPRDSRGRGLPAVRRLPMESKWSVPSCAASSSHSRRLRPRIPANRGPASSGSGPLPISPDLPDLPCTASPTRLRSSRAGHASSVTNHS
jgi:hypothetical protein